MIGVINVFGFLFHWMTSIYPQKQNIFSLSFVKIFKKNFSVDWKLNTCGDSKLKNHGFMINLNFFLSKFENCFFLFKTQYLWRIKRLIYLENFKNFKEKSLNSIAKEL